MRISGFTIVRNAVRLGYPFKESIRSLIPLCDEIVIGIGDSDDETPRLREELDLEFPGRLRWLKSNWSTVGQSGGMQLRDRSNEALAACTGDWCFYLQADEVLHEADYPRIREALKNADTRAEIDGLVFDYLHFYGSYDYQIRGRNWYRREMRAFKNGRGIQAFRDAQGFRKGGQRCQAIHSGAKVYHYGYVRSLKSLKTKSTEMARWWGQAPDFDDSHTYIRHVGLRKFTEPHPAVMAERIRLAGSDFDPTKCPRRWDKDEIKNAITIAWESVFPFRIGEFRNYDLH